MNTGELEKFLRDDLHDALKELFVGAVTWQANPEAKNHRYLRDLGMFSCFVQARALYEFFYKQRGKPDDARANHFAPSWKATDTAELFQRYMAERAPAQKRVFHLVYERSSHSGGTAPDESDHLKNQVVNLARDLLRLTNDFVLKVEPSWHLLAASALGRALRAADELAKEYEIPNPIS